MIGAIEIFARHGENIGVADEITEGSVQIISSAGEPAIHLAGKKFIAIDGEIEIVRIIAI